MIIEEVISKKEWNSYVFGGSFDVGLSSCIGLEEMLMESRNLVYEDQKDVREYKEFIDIEKSNSIQYADLIQGKLFFPIQYRGAPFQETIILDVPTTDCKFIKSDNINLYFLRGRKPIDMVKSRPGILGVYDTLIFSDKLEAEQHLLALKLKFNGWDIKTRYI